jgi:hypothetical protein
MTFVVFLVGVLVVLCRWRRSSGSALDRGPSAYRADCITEGTGQASLDVHLRQPEAGEGE